MKFRPNYILIIGVALCACSQTQKPAIDVIAGKPGSFAYDLSFLKKYDSVIVLKSNDSSSRVIVSPKYQGKVFTSTAAGDTGRSFGWINYKSFDAKTDPHMNAYGGEDRLWLGPEGGKYSLFFKAGTKMEFANWYTPAAFDHENWSVVSKSDKQVSLTKNMILPNYTGATLELTINRDVSLLERDEIQKALGIQLDDHTRSVGIKTTGSITNSSPIEWTTETGAPCLWNLDMFTPSPGVTIVIPYNEKATGKVATTDYFGQIPPDRVTYKNGHLFLKADGKSRGKVGMPPSRATSVEGSYDATNNVLTITSFDVDSKAIYLNQEWTPDKDPLVGDAVNAYNDGPLANGSQLGPFFEMESVSPGAFLKPGKKLLHNHSIFHFTGDKASLDKIAVKVLGVSLDEISSAFKK